MQRFLSAFLFLFLYHISGAQNKSTKGSNPVFVDMQGVLRYSKTNAEASFFGVNYTVPFAYGYRSHKALGVDLEKAIDADVYHFQRLGFDAFRVHMWDVEISDSLGNVLENEHLRLFDYLVAQCKKRGIKILITPIAFWGNGYPERDEKTIGFSSVYGKGPAVVLEKAIKAQEVYMEKMVAHINPYTKLAYKDDPDIIALEINNEPHHSGPKEKTTEYVNRLANAVKKGGWTKPVFYNISESPTYADAVVKAAVEGHSFQWYPTGLVAGRELKGNYLPNVDVYKIPFGDTIKQFNNRAKMVYEFDAGDVMQSYMYPAMARAFRTAGFQWATQFAYDPLATAYANTEYQTHYLNLAYTPAKAISLLIASKVFHKIPRLKSYGSFPTDTLFDVFRVSYKNNLGEMNSEEEFYYSNTTASQPKNRAALKKIAGVGSSAVVEYSGLGAYFLDKVSDGVWKLEVMPDAIPIRDPFEKASPKKEVTRIQWQWQNIKILLPDLGADFTINGINKGNNFSAAAVAGKFIIEPGVYLLNRQSKTFIKPSAEAEFYAPPASRSAPYVHHIPHHIVSASVPFYITTKIAGIDSAGNVSVEIRNAANKWKTIQLQRQTAYDYAAEVPADMVAPGLLNYRILVQAKNNEWVTFPGAIKGNPYAWDYYENETYQTFVASSGAALSLFDPGTDRSKLNIYNPDWRNNTIEYTSAESPTQLVFKARMNNPAPAALMGWQLYIGDKLSGRKTEITSFDKLIVRARAGDANTKIKVAIITADGAAYATTFTAQKSVTSIEIPLSSLQLDSSLLLPRPYPGFLPLWFKAATTAGFALSDADKLEITFGNTTAGGKPLEVEIESVELRKRN